MEKFNPYERHSVATVRQMQVVYLSAVCGLPYAEIAEITGYAVSTVRNYAHKYDYMGELVQAYFDSEVNQPTKPENILYRRFKDGRPAVAMEFMPGCGENLKNEQAVYFFKFYNADSLEFNKIGTSAKDVVGRLRDEIGEYTKKYPIVRVEICRIRSCGEQPAEGAESALRSELIKRYPTAFRKNDRFFGADIDPTVFDEILNQHFA